MQQPSVIPPTVTVDGDPIGLWLSRSASACAVFGGIVLLTLIALCVFSVLGRWLADSPIEGDFELVQIGCAIAVSSFLPYCQLQRGHVIVDFFTSRWSPGTIKLLDSLGALLLAGCAALLAWRLTVGTFAARTAEELTMIRGLPIWWGYVPMVIAFALLAAVALRTAWCDVRESNWK